MTKDVSVSQKTPTQESTFDDSSSISTVSSRSFNIASCLFSRYMWCPSSKASEFTVPTKRIPGHPTKRRCVPPTNEPPPVIWITATPSPQCLPVPSTSVSPRVTVSTLSKSRSLRSPYRAKASVLPPSHGLYRAKTSVLPLLSKSLDLAPEPRSLPRQASVLPLLRSLPRHQSIPQVYVCRGDFGNGIQPRQPSLCFQGLGVSKNPGTMLQPV
jgi:hypothetical protein